MFRTIPLHIAPGPDDRAALEARREALIRERDRAPAPGEVRPAYLAQVAAGPVPIYKRRARV